MSSAASMIYPNNDVVPRTTITTTTRSQRCQRRNSLPRTFPLHKNCVNSIVPANRKQYCLSDFDTINVAASNTAAATTTTTSRVSLHYISQFLTPDTLILPRQFSFMPKPMVSQSNTTCPYSNSDHLHHHHHHHHLPTNLCHHHLYHHHHHHNNNHLDHLQHRQQQQQQHQIHLDMKMVSESSVVNADNCAKDSAVDAATAQLEEIIRLCRTLQTKTSNNTDEAAMAASTITNDQNQYYHCSGCCNIHVGCRCSADCVQYFIRNEEFMADMTKAAAIAVMKAAKPSSIQKDSTIKPTKLPESIDDLKPSSTRSNMDNNDGGGVEPCQLLLSKMDSGNGNMQIMETNNASSTVRSTPTIHSQHLQPKHRTNIEMNVNNNYNNNGSSHFVTELVAKFEDKKKKKCSPPSPPTRSSTSTSYSNLPSPPPTTTTTKISSPSLLDTMQNNNHNHNHNHNNSPPFRDKHQTDTFSDGSSYHQQHQPKSTTVLSTATNLNEKRVQLPQSTVVSSSSLLPMQPISSDLTKEKCDNASDFLNKKNNDINKPPKIRTKPKPPPKPSSLMLLSASSNANKSIASNQNEDCQKLSSSIQNDPKSSKTILSNDWHQSVIKHPSLVSGKKDADEDCINGTKCVDDDQSSSRSGLPDPLICHSDKIGIHGIQDNKNNNNNDDTTINDKRIGNINENLEILPSLSLQPIGNMHESLDDSKLLCPKLNDSDQITMKSSETFNLTNSDHHPKSSTMATTTNTNNNNPLDESSNKCQSYCCCCCCCPSSGNYGNCSNGGNQNHNHNNKLLGIDLTKINHSINKLKTSTRKLPPPPPSSSPAMNHCTSTTIVEVDDNSDLIRQDHHHHHHHNAKQSQPNLAQTSITANNQSSFINNNHNLKSKSTKCSDSDVLVIVDEINSDEQSGLGSSDNSSSDEGIENPAILDDYDEEEDIDDDDVDVEVGRLNVKSNKLNAIDTNSSCHYLHNNNNNNRRNHTLHHSHHQHHFNHHNQLVNHNHHLSDSNRKSPSLSFKSNRTVSPLFPQSTNADDVQQAEKFLNGTDSKHLNQLKQEEALLLKEIFELESEQSDTTTAAATSCLDTNEDVDEELLEFQRIEREIKLSELRKCLLLVQKQIKTYQSKLEQELIDLTTNTEDFDSITMATTATNSDSSLMNEHHQLNQAQLQVEKNINTLVQSKSSAMAPLAEPEMDEVSKTDSLEPEVVIINPELDLSDSDESDAEEVLESTTPIGDNIHDPQRSLDDLLHESIETRLEKVNDITEQEQESFVANSAKPEESSSSLTRRTSRYDNEKPHDCRMKHFGYHRNVDMLMLKSVYQKLDLDKYDSETDIKRIMNASSISNEMLESTTTTTTATDSETDSIVLRRRSARFPADDSTNDSNPHLQSQDELSTHSDQPVLRNKRISAVSSNSSTAVGGGSQRPLTLYMPAPNQKINLITHLHALGHDLTSSIVTNHLLLTPYTCSGYLYKHCSSGVGKWRKRYFHFDRVRKVFVYYHDRSDFEKMRHPKRGVFFDEIQDVYVDHTRINMKKFLSNSGNDKHSNLSNQQKYGSPGAMTSPAKADGTRCVFVVSTATFSRKFILSTFTPELMRIWMDVIFTGAQAYLQDFDDQLMN